MCVCRMHKQVMLHDIQDPVTFPEHLRGFSSSHATLEMIRSGFFEDDFLLKLLNVAWCLRTSRLWAVVVFVHVEVGVCDEVTRGGLFRHVYGVALLLKKVSEPIRNSVIYYYREPLTVPPEGQPFQKELFSMC